ncbi:MAG: glycerophosphoryl diester phosphodiesterase [Solirubrobacteraceae bacterium]|nr:glycerophosphoryl diester phosphodiesterase [Solirubrobacteraceae bacterium]
MAYRSLALAGLAAAAVLPATAAAAQPTLTGRAALPASTFAAGPPSGTHIAPPFGAGVSAPFPSQPVQGFSAFLPAAHGDLLAMPDNGYGSLENSADFNLRIYRIHPDYERGTVAVKSFVQLRDPDHRLPFSIVNEFSSARVLTGADFDSESLQRDPADGTLWIGDEFGPFLLHTSADGRVLGAPVSLPDPDTAGKDVRAPQSPLSEESSPQRLMNALNARGRARGGATTPIVSPDANLLADGNPATAVPEREGSNGLPAASSEIFDVAKLHSAGYKVVPYTVDDPAAMDKLIALGVDGLITDRPDLARQRLAADKPSVLLPDGRVDPAKFDLEGHRGARNLRPENTLPAVEAGLDELINTVETDNGITSDGVPVLDHEPYVSSVRCRRADGRPYGVQDEQLVKDVSLAELQSKYTCDNVFRGPSQTNDRSASPIAVAFAQHEGLRDPYVMPTTKQLFDFVRFYRDWYANGPGASDAHAAPRAANAGTVRFNIETKVNPRSDRDDHGNVYSQRTIAAKPFADTVAGVIEDAGMASRSFVQSFDFRTLERVQDTHSDLQLVALWGDTPKGPGVDEDGTNLQPEPGQATSPWLGGLIWPYRQTARSTPFRAQTSGGFEGMARRGSKLLPMLEKPLAGGPADQTSIFEYDTRKQQWTGARWRYRYDPKGVSIGDFQLADGQHGLTLERDNGQGTTARFKTIEQITLGKGDGHVVEKSPVVDELRIADPNRLSLATPANQPGDLLVGDPFGLPFNTIEDLVIAPGGRNLTVGVDNNYPFSVGRHVGTGAPDDDEIVTLRLPRKVG